MLNNKTAKVVTVNKFKRKKERKLKISLFPDSMLCQARKAMPGSSDQE